MSKVVRAKAIIKAWGAPNGVVDFDDARCVAELLKVMEADLKSVTTSLVSVLEVLCSPFLNTLTALGGPDSPDDDEVAKAKAAIEYFQGGAKPKFIE